MTAPFTDEVERLRTTFSALAARYEDAPLTWSVPRLREAHGTAITLTARRTSKSHTRALASIASRISSLYADALFNTGQVDTARRLAASAFRLALIGDDVDGVGYARKIGAGIEIFEGKAGAALAIASDGQRRAAGTPTGIACRVAHARAAALAGVQPNMVITISERAIADAYALPASKQCPVGAESPDGIHPLEVTYHALIAAAVVGDAARARTWAEVVIPALQSMNRPGFAAVATAHLAALNVRHGDIAAAAAQVEQAVTAAPRPFRALARPLAAFATDAKPYAANPEIRDAADRIQTWHAAGSADL